MTKHTKWKSVASLHGKRALFAKECTDDQFAPRQEADKPLETVMQARARQMNRKATDAMLGSHLCEDTGRAIDIGSKNETECKALWGVFISFDKAEHNYFRQIIGRPRFPSVSKMEFMPERLETRADDRPDLRSEDEKIRDASNGWARWQGYLGHLAAHERSAIIRAAWQMDDLHKGDTLTAAGNAFVLAMRSLREVVDALEKK